MASRDYILCDTGNCKVVYDGDDNGRNMLEQTHDVRELTCPGCVKALRAENERLRAEAADFHGAYRMKCDEETKAQLVEIERLRAALDAQKAQEHLDTTRLDWLMHNVSGAEWRKLGVFYGAGCSREDIDEAMIR